MKKWELFRELVKGTTFYTRNFIIIALFGIALIGGGYLVKNQYFSANPYSSPSDMSSGSSQNIKLTVTKNGWVKKDGQRVDKIILGKTYDELNYKILDHPGVYIDSLEVQVYFESAIPKDQTKHWPIVIHSESISGTSTRSSTLVDDHTIIYSGQFLGADTKYTVHAELPKGVIKPPFYRSFASYLNNLGLNFWVIFAIFLPFMTIIILLGLTLKRAWPGRRTTLLPISAPPEKVPPAVLGVLIHGRISAREIAATLMDLADRNYIHIFQEGNNFYFGRGKALESDKIYELLPYEKLLLSKIFLPKSVKSSGAELNIRLGEQLFSKKMAQVFLEIYNQVERYGFFEQNPMIVHQKYKYYGVSLLIGGLIGFTLNAVFNQTAHFLLLFWVGMILSAAAIIRIGFVPGMPVFTPKGRAYRDQWLGFRVFISQIDRSKAASFHQGNADMYFEYLPYAIVMDVEREWTLRFIKDPFCLPRWYDSNVRIFRLEDFANSLFPIVAFIARNLIISRTPVVD